MRRGIRPSFLRYRYGATPRRRAVAVIGTTTAKRIFIYEDDTDHRFGKQPLDDVIGDKDGIAYEASVLFRKRVTGKKFLSAAG